MNQAPIPRQEGSQDEALKPSLGQVRRFWEANPLSTIESPFRAGTKEFFDWHEQVRQYDVEPFAMHLYGFNRHQGERVLDVGCGIGWLCRHFARNDAQVTGVDITRRGLELTSQRVCQEGLDCDLVQASAELLPFETDSFDFVTCAGVLHHTPDALQGVREIHRVLRPGGRAMISLYHRNWLLSKSMWPLTRFLIRTCLGYVPGRSAFKGIRTADDFVRAYDGDANPLGKSYSRFEVVQLLSDFMVERMEVHYFPRRFLPVGGLLPRWMHRLLDRYCGLMVYAEVRKTGENGKTVAADSESQTTLRSDGHEDRANWSR
jgi:2-polyprenyl-3-methyl-5-hydroxy-6-metoxy-1,4-benzoquinol methylase